MSFTTVDETDTTYELGADLPEGTVTYHYHRQFHRACVGFTPIRMTPGSSVVPLHAVELACGQIEHDGSVSGVSVDPGADMAFARLAMDGINGMRHMVTLPAVHQVALAEFEYAISYLL